MKCCNKNCNQGRICHKPPAKAVFYWLLGWLLFLSGVVYLLSPAANASEFSGSLVVASIAPIESPAAPPKPEKPKPEPVPPDNPPICWLAVFLGGG